MEYPKMSALDDWSIESSFPAADGRKVLILYNSDLESDLLSSIAIERYGLNNVVWLGVEDFAINSNTSDLQPFKYNFTDSITVNFGGIHRIYIPKNKLRDNFGFYSRMEYALKQITSYKPELTTRDDFYFFIGTSEAEVLTHKIAVDTYYNYNRDVMRCLDNNPEYVSIMNEYIKTRSLDRQSTVDDIARVVNLVINLMDRGVIDASTLTLLDGDFGNLPFSSLTYDKIAQLAINLGKESVLLDSWNCHRTFHKLQKRCGVCSRCLQFKHALSTVNKLEDVEFAE